MSKQFILFFSIMLLLSHCTVLAQIRVELPQKLKSLNCKKKNYKEKQLQFYTKVKLFIKQRLEIRKVIETLFPLASVSKAVSATAIALMVDQES
ncbi:hypothetical protein FLA4_03820 [Candidatus Rickettsia kotlanii]|nr:hypothetical protein FLA4_03820 [Candidatus Rickettsia kotlanii]BDU61215.1 hypothetical protein HM2_03830 [Candidatus Rickettsia kotlanii]